MTALPLPAPPLGDDRILLRPWRAQPADAEALAAAWADPLVQRHTAVPTNHAVEDAARWIAGEQRRRSAGLALDLAIEDLASGSVVGEVGLARFTPFPRSAEVGWWTSEGVRGQGYASAAVDLVARWALDALALQQLVARIDPDNRASQRVAESAGFRRTRERGVLVREREMSSGPGS